MDHSTQLILLVILYEVVYAQDSALRTLYAKMMSPQCRQKPVEQAYNCCIIPDLFEIETNQGCNPSHQVVLQPAERGSPDCAERTCLLRNNDLLFDNDEIDKDSVKQYLDEWAAKRREYMPAVNAVKEKCVGKIPMFGPKEMCDADKLLFCINSNFYNKCPNWLETEGCTALRAYLEACMPYYD